MRIAIDMQGLQTGSRSRGIGRYTKSFVTSLLQQRNEHEVLLILNGMIPETIEPIRNAFSDLIAPENFLIWSAAGPVKEGQNDNGRRRQLAELSREAFIEVLQPDAVVITSFFEGYLDDAVTSIGKFESNTPTLVVLYDLIPLLNPAAFFEFDREFEKHYTRKVDELNKADKLLAISDSARREALEVLPAVADDIVTIGTAVEPYFQHVSISEQEENQLRNKFSIDGRIVLNSGGFDPRKNLKRLVRAFGEIPQELRKGSQLVLAGNVSQEEAADIMSEARSVKLNTDEVILTGYVTDEELRALYSICDIFVFPSWHEGFGLPALEAMSCGARVLVSNTSSLPEIVQWDDATFSPYDVASIAGAIRRALGDAEFRDALKQNSILQAARFSWETSADIAWQTIESMRRKTLAHSNMAAWNCWHEYVQHRDKVYRRFVSHFQELMSELGEFNERELLGQANATAVNLDESDRYARSGQLPEKLTWRIEGPFDSTYSLALLNRETARSLRELGHDIALHATEGYGDYSPSMEWLSKNPDIAELYKRASDMPPTEVDVTSRNLYPPRVNDMESRINLLHHFAWEETGVPDEWVRHFNQYLQAVTCLSNHVLKVLIDNGVTIPSVVSGCGVDHWERIEFDDKFDIAHRGFCFLHVSSCFPRKGIDVLLNAYGAAFRNTDDVTLIIKTFPNPHNSVWQRLEEAQRDSQFPHVVIVSDDLTDRELKSLYSICDVMVAPSRAEGFGLPLAEALLSGMPVITTGWGGPLDFCVGDWAWLIDYRFERARTHIGIHSSVWAEPDEGHLARAMCEAFEMAREERKERAARGRCYVMENFRWSDVVKRLEDTPRQVVSREAVVKPTIGWVSSWRERCGIATYSAHLLENMPNDILILASGRDDPRGRELDNVVRCWRSDGDDTLGELEKEVEEKSVDVLMIQFNYSFFDFSRLASFIERQVEYGRTVCIELHSTVDDIPGEEKSLKRLASSLMLCDRVLVHSPEDLNRLKQLGIVENAALFPHGVITKKGRTLSRQAPESRMVIASFGFFLPHKGLLELIEAINSCVSDGMDVHLYMINAEYPSTESGDLVASVKRYVKSLGMIDRVTIVTDFLPEEDTLGWLKQADLIVFPYQKTGESASGAVRVALASGRPVAVTPLEIFDDVREVTLRLDGCSSRDVAAGIRRIYEEGVDCANRSVEEVLSKAETWRNEYSYSILGPRLYRILCGLHYKNCSSRQGIGVACSR